MLLSSLHARPRYTHLHGSSDALALAQYAKLHGPLAVISASALEAQRLVEEISLFDAELRVHLLPDWETLPYDHFSPHHDLISDRLSALHHIRNHSCDVIVVPITTALYPFPPLEYLAAFTFFLKCGEQLHINKFREQMTLAGYAHVQQVLVPGEYCVRGGLIDLFPMGSSIPYRIDLLDDQIDTMATFDVDTQRTIYPVREIRLLPTREFSLDDAGQKCFRKNFRERFDGDPSKVSIYKDVSRGVAPAGIEYYLPLFFEHTATFADYLSADTTLCLHHDVSTAISLFLKDAESRYHLLGCDPQRPLLKPHELFLSAERFFVAVKGFKSFNIVANRVSPLTVDNLGHVKNLVEDDSGVGGTENEGKTAASCHTQDMPNVSINRRADMPTERLHDFLNGYDGRVLLLADSPGRREILAEYLHDFGMAPVSCENYTQFIASSEPFMLAVGVLQNGFVLPDDRLAIVTESELYASQPRNRIARTAKRTSIEWMLRDLSELKLGDYVVHEQHGIARYCGLVNLDFGEGENEFLLLEYAGGDKLYVPVAQLHMVSRYSGGAPESVSLSRLGSGSWDKTKRRAMEQVRDAAVELLNRCAQRATRKGHKFKLTPRDYEAFSAGFGFEETVDQAAAIGAVINDLQSDKPMDRLICGDVGFGKTEVALRASFVAAMDGKQVAVLVPTTLLTEQHFKNFCNRFSDWPIKIGELSRFRSAKEQAQVLKDMESGAIDIVIGTHKLIKSGIKFNNLGLIIIDEEHRFGVQQKEHLKALRAEVDVLTLTATPIPRTLAMSLEGLRDFSVIATAPQRRLSIKTFVSNRNQGVIREAVLRELKRGGQIYFLHNEINTIVSMAATLEKLLPEAHIRVAHGQMGERDLEAVMRDFYQQRFDILLCTTIIETGIDIPSANTIIINRADNFGLAQLHQLRGRVGRSHHQAYAYLLVENMEELTVQAKKRLDAIQAMEQLGSGFYLAMHDLEIRGAGEVLGESQSGEMHGIGFSLYTDMLNAAISSLRSGLEPDMTYPLGVATEINLHTPALLPNDYCGDIHQRLVLYKRLANCATPEELDDMYQELVDRFGLIPPPTKVLLDCHRLRIAAKKVGIVKVDASSDAILIQFLPNPPLDPGRIVELIQSKRQYKLSGQDRIKIDLKYEDVGQRVLAIKNFFNELA